MEKANSIAILRPDLLDLWDYETNVPLTPENVSVMSHQLFSWKCKIGHTWIRDPQHQTRIQHSECPYCTGRIVIPGDNDLATLYPQLLNQWHPTKNGDLDPCTLLHASNKRAWWKCDNGHEWRTTISKRTDADNPTGCPYCKGLCVVIGVNDLQSQRPDIAAQWHPIKNTLFIMVTAKVNKFGWEISVCAKEQLTKLAYRERVRSADGISLLGPR